VAEQAGGRSGAFAFWGAHSGLGLLAAILACTLDQASKLWLLFVYDLPGRGNVHLAPFLDLALTWNTGISYGLFPQEGPVGQWLLLAVKVAVVVVLVAWLARTRSRLTAVALGLIVGGALGNAIDRVAYGAVVDFILFYVATTRFTFHWYVFNLADAAIVAGVVGLLYESLVGERAAKAPRSGL
jgi:signal peptidase II